MFVGIPAFAGVSLQFPVGEYKGCVYICRK